jgi:hypothetical protein
MAIAEFKPRPEYSLQDELDRKVLDTLEKLDMKYSTGQITEGELAQGMQALYTACFGLVVDKSLQDIMDAYEPTVRVKSRYFMKLRKGQDLIFLMWAVEDENIEIMTAFTGAVRKVQIPLEETPHLFFNKVLTKLTSSGWSECNDNNGVDYDED